MEVIEHAATLLDKSTLVFTRHLAVSPEKLWKAIGTKEGLSHWFMPTKYEIVQGGRFSFQDGWDGTISQVHVLHLIQFTPDESQDAYLRFEILATDSGSIFKLIDRMGSAQDVAQTFPDAPQHRIYQPGGPGTHWSGIIAGYHGFVDELEGYITGTKPESDYDDLCKRYMSLLDKWFDSSTAAALDRKVDKE